jgi:hypothetical protein
MVRSGTPERVARDVTDHKTRPMFDRYNIVDEEDVREAMARVSAYHAALSGSSEQEA